MRSGGNPREANMNSQEAALLVKAAGQKKVKELAMSRKR